MPLNSIAENFEVSRPAISRHIKILTECGIVTIHTRGRERYCEARLQKLSEVSQWVDHFRVYWNQKLDALGEFLERRRLRRRLKGVALVRGRAARDQVRRRAPRDLGRRRRPQKRKKITNMEKAQVIVERTYDASPARVWRAITDPAQMKQAVSSGYGFSARKRFRNQF
ncbi:ArsR family transcriptional regulator [Puia sp. P3]|uniref:ArsR family transcriptional regulator n=1 Tax=Puia sp. P3 TaxID=3423952 RepID=UPI003D66B40B